MYYEDTDVTYTFPSEDGREVAYNPEPVECSSETDPDEGDYPRTVAPWDRTAVIPVSALWALLPALLGMDSDRGHS